VSDDAGRERQVTELARRIAELGGRQRARLLQAQWWSDRLLAHSMADPAFRTALFRFVDTYPALRGDTDVERHLRGAFEGVTVPAWFDRGIGLAERVPGGERLTARVVRRGIDTMARQFVIGATAAEVAGAAGAMWRRHTATTVDLLGEHTHSAADATRYATRLAAVVDALADAAPTWPDDDLLEADDLGRVPRASVSVKVSALTPRLAPLSGDEGIDEAESHLLPTLRTCAARGVIVWFDAERYDTKDLTQRLFRRLLERPELGALHAGIVIQAYLRDAAADLAALAEWAKGRRLPVGVRLVKGAYWDAETVQAAANGWPAPVFEHKAATDAAFERLIGLLHDQHGTLRASFASHNLRSIAVSIVEARQRGIPDHGYELQLLYGMAEPVHDALRRMGARLRVYAPMGELVPGMAYLVRRLLENTSNESFVRHHFAEGEDLDLLLAAPGTPARAEAVQSRAPAARRAPSDPGRPGPYRPEPPAQWWDAEVRARFAAAVDEVFEAPVASVPARIGGEQVTTAGSVASIDPARPTDVVARAAACGPEEVAAAVALAAEAAPGWRAEPAPGRAAVLLRAAEVLRTRRAAVAALEVREAGKPWAEADADVCEAIDFCEYYARAMLVLDAGGSVQSPPGEANRLSYHGRGVGAVIAPWNFPLAIATGMTVAALVAGNAVVLKPAEQTPAVAEVLVDALAEAGLPPAVLGFVPGLGEEAGAALVADPRVDVIAFTGSRAVGLGIVEAAARQRPGRRSIPRVIAELGGKNPVVVDADADLDVVVPAVLHSAFGFAGQKCSAASRLIAHDAVHDELVARLVEATKALRIGPPRLPGTDVPPVIDRDAYDRLHGALARAGEVGEVVLARGDVPDEGHYVGPAIVTGVRRDSWLATDELFGPVLACFRVRDLDEAVSVANDSAYALTAGVFSRSDAAIRAVCGALRAGNVYVNRAITGAVVGRQPFGGNGLSGVGSKAGGPDYLLQFCDPAVVTENTIRQGFVPLDDAS
jgi:RHH-type proline utilization regulon transcriptional repressor/proline dehydrogenase/delta 1-pyrroline-5-carboxylate dehydrogenase